MNSDTMLKDLPITFQHPPLLIAGRARQHYGLEPADYSGDYDLVVSSEDFTALRMRYPDGYSIGDFDDPRITVDREGSIYEFYASFELIAYKQLIRKAELCGDHLVASLPRLLLMEIAAYEHAPNEEQRQRVIAILVKRGLVIGGGRGDE